MTGELPAQRASNAENVSTWWRHAYECTGANEMIFNNMAKIELDKATI